MVHTNYVCKSVERSVLFKWHKMYICVVHMHVCLDGKIGINYVHMRDWQLSKYAIVLNIAHLILKGRMYTTDCFL